MQDIFISPSDNVTRGWWDFFGDAIKNDFDGAFPSRLQVQQLGIQSSGSYNYATAAMTDYRCFAYNPRNGAVLDNNFFGLQDGQNPTAFFQYAKRNNMAEVQFPSQKVLFYMRNAWHNPDLEAWFQQGATIPVAMADGSARVTKPYEDGLARNPREQAGPIYNIFFTAIGATTAWPGHYFATCGGIKGRDL
jgi:hypothetical protein